MVTPRNNLKDAEMLKPDHKGLNVKDEQFIINEMGATIATYAGEGSMDLFYLLSWKLTYSVKIKSSFINGVGN